MTAPDSGAAAALARALVRGRWWVVLLWTGVGAFAATEAARVPDRLDVRGGSLEPTEASRVDALLATRFRQDIGETFLVLVSGPGPFDHRRPQAVLDSLGAGSAVSPTSATSRHSLPRAIRLSSRPTAAPRSCS